MHVAIIAAGELIVLDLCFELRCLGAAERLLGFVGLGELAGLRSHSSLESWADIFELL